MRQNSNSANTNSIVTSFDIKDALNYALGGDVPESFLEHLIQHIHLWDSEFMRRLDEYAYELYPELAIWELEVTSENELVEKRLPYTQLS